jgi:hypothetical protein
VTTSSQAQYERAIVGYLHKFRFATIAPLSEMLAEKFKLLPAAARQVVGRAVDSGAIRSSAPVTFGKGRFAYFLPDSRLSLEFVLEITAEYRPALYRVLTVMSLQGGYISFYEALKVAASVLDNTTNHKELLKKLIRELVLLKLAKTVKDESGDQYIIFRKTDPFMEPAVNVHKSLLATDARMIPDILQMLQRNNIIERSTVMFRNRNTPLRGIEHINHVWDAVGYTKATGYNPGLASESITPDKQTLVVLDILLYRDYTMEDFQGFYERVQSVFKSVKMGKRKVIPIIIFRNTDPLTFNTIHKVGFLTYSLGAVYGERIYEVLANLNKLKQQALGESKINFTEVVEETLAIVKSTGQDANLGNLRGDLFEFLLYPLLVRIFPNSRIEHSVKIGSKAPVQKGYEYDYRITTATGKIVIIEAKGYRSDKRIYLGEFDKKYTVQWFFSTTFPFAQTMIKEHSENADVRCVYITSASFEPLAVTYLEKMNEGRTKPKEMDIWYDGTKLLSLLREYELNHIEAILKKYYFVESLPAYDQDLLGF